MKKIELKSMAEYFGKFLPAGHIKDRETRIAIVRLYGSLAKANMDVINEIESIRTGLVGDKQDDVNKYAALIQKSFNKDLAEEERKKAREEAEAMTECVRIDKDYSEAVTKVYNEEIEPELKKVSLEVLYEALSDCGFPRFSPEMTIADVAETFKDVIE